MDNFTLESGRGLDIAHSLWQEIHGTKRDDKLVLINVSAKRLILDTRKIQSNG